MSGVARGGVAGGGGDVDGGVGVKLDEVSGTGAEVCEVVAELLKVQSWPKEREEPVELEKQGKG